MFKAEEHIHLVTERSPERLAVKDLDEKKAELASVELDIKLAELHEIDEQIGALLQEKTTLHQRIHGKLSDLLPDLARLDDIEREGTALSAQMLTLQMDTHSPLGSHWRDPKLSGVSMLLKTWLQRLEA